MILSIELCNITATNSINILCVCVMLYFIIVGGMDNYTYVVCDGKVVYSIYNNIYIYI